MQTMHNTVRVQSLGDGCYACGGETIRGSKAMASHIKYVAMTCPTRSVNVDHDMSDYEAKCLMAELKHYTKCKFSVKPNGIIFVEA